MRAAVVSKPGSVGVQSVDDPTPQWGQVVVRVGACGLCGTDLHIAAGEFPPTPYPIVPGHEFAGEVVAVGSGVDQLTEGTRVAVDPSLFCGHCDFCRRGRGNLCEYWGAIGDTVDGAFAEYVAVPARNAYPLPERISLREGALIEPLSCAVHGLKRLAPQPADTFCIVGGGTMGLLLLQLAVHSGAAGVTMVDANPERLPRAQALGAEQTATSVAAALEDRPGGFDCVIDATGVAAAIEDGLTAVRRGGKLMIFGVAPADARVALSPFRVYNDEITVVGSMAVLHSFPAALELLRRGIVDVGSLLTHTFDLADFPQALETVRGGGGLKVQVLPAG